MLIDPQESIKNAYYAKLEGNIFLNGLAVPVYVAVSEPTPAPYVYFADQTINETQIAAACTQGDCTILLDLVTEYPTNQVRESEVNSIAEQVRTLLQPLNGETVDNFQFTRHVLENSNTVKELAGNYKRVRRLMRFRDTIVNV